MVKITAPNSQYSGVSAGIRFADGVAYTDNVRAIDWFKEHKYEVEENAIPDFAEMTAKELQNYAADNGIDLGGATKKADIISKITEGKNPADGNQGGQ